MAQHSVANNVSLNYKFCTLNCLCVEQMKNWLITGIEWSLLDVDNQSKTKKNPYQKLMNKNLFQAEISPKALKWLNCRYMIGWSVIKFSIHTSWKAFVNVDLNNIPICIFISFNKICKSLNRKLSSNQQQNEHCTYREAHENIDFVLRINTTLQNETPYFIEHNDEC